MSRRSLPTGVWVVVIIAVGVVPMIAVAGGVTTLILVLDSSGVEGRYHTLTQLQRPIYLHPVQETHSPPCTSDQVQGERSVTGSSASTPVCYSLEEGVQVTHFKSVEVTRREDASSFQVYIVFPSEYVDEIRALTQKLSAQNPPGRLATVADDVVLFAPSVYSAIMDGRLVMSGNYSRSEAEELRDRLTGR